MIRHPNKQKDRQTEIRVLYFSEIENKYQFLINIFSLFSIHTSFKKLNEKLEINKNALKIIPLIPQK